MGQDTEKVDLTLNVEFAEQLEPDVRAGIERLLDKNRRFPSSVSQEERALLDSLVRQNPRLFVRGASLESPGVSLRQQPPPPKGRTFLQTLPEAGGAAIGAALGTAGGPLGMIAGAGIGAAAGRAGGILGGVETPATSLESAEMIGEAGAVGATTEFVFRGLAKGRGGLFRRGPTLSERALASEEQQLVKEFGVEFTPGQLTKSRLLQAFESILERTITGPFAAREQAVRNNRQLNIAIDRLVNSISVARSRKEAGDLFAASLQTLRRSAGKEFGTARELLEATRGNETIKFTSSRAEEIRRLLDEIVEISGAAPGSKTAARELKALSDATIDPSLPAAIQAAINKPNPTVSELLVAAERMRLLRDATNNRKVSGALRKARQEIFAELGEKLEGSPELAEFNRARVRLAEVEDALTDSFLRKMAKSKRGSEVLGASLVNSSAISRAQDIKTIFGGRVPDVARRAFVEEIIERASQPGSKGLGRVVPGNSLEKVLKDVGDDTINTVLEPNEAAALRKLSELSDALNLPAILTQPESAVRPSLLALGQSGQVGRSVASGNPLLALLGSGITLGVPDALSRLVFSRNGAELLAKAALAKRRTNEFTKLFLRMAAIVLREGQSEETEQDSEQQ